MCFKQTLQPPWLKPWEWSIRKRCVPCSALCFCWISSFFWWAVFPTILWGPRYASVHQQSLGHPESSLFSWHPRMQLRASQQAPVLWRVCVHLGMSPSEVECLCFYFARGWGKGSGCIQNKRFLTATLNCSFPILVDLVWTSSQSCAVGTSCRRPHDFTVGGEHVFMPWLLAVSLCFAKGLREGCRCAVSVFLCFSPWGRQKYQRETKNMLFSPEEESRLSNQLRHVHGWFLRLAQPTVVSRWTTSMFHIPGSESSFSSWFSLWHEPSVRFLTLMLELA